MLPLATKKKIDLTKKVIDLSVSYPQFPKYLKEQSLIRYLHILINFCLLTYADFGRVTVLNIASSVSYSYGKKLWIREYWVLLS